MGMNKALFFGIAALGLAAPASAGNWPQFRGPDGRGQSQESDLPTVFGPTTNVLWKVKIPGVAWSSPIVWEEKVFVTTAIPDGDQETPQKGLYFGGNRKKPRDHEYSWEVWCLDRESGKVLWKDVAKHGKPRTSIHLKNTYASETPATDGKHLVVHFGGVGLYVYDLSGKRLWEKDLGAFKTRLGWGMGSSPIIEEGRTYIQYDNEEQSFVVALDVASGKELWRAERDEYSSWATPFFWRTPQRNELVTAASKRVRSYDPASGKLLWELEGMSSIAVPTPFAGHGLCYVDSGYVGDTRHRPIFAIRPGASGNISLGEKETSNASIAWCLKMAGTYMPTPVLWGENLYVLYDRGMMACFNAKTGATVYAKERLRPSGSAQITASPVVHQGKIYCFSEEGDAYVVEAGPSYKLLQRHALDEMCMATPAIAANALYVRTMQNLYCFRNLDGAAVSRK